MSETSAMANHLAGASSPYLLQHANNPVDWYPWGEEAFAKAARENKPILLSIGYATCHWCHVMEQESFEDPEVGRVLNANVVAIKVDREERPDIDQVYMQAAQMMNGGGGWPLNILMTPDRRPFYAATYLPKHSRFNRIGLIELVERIGEVWRTDPDKLLLPAGQLQDAMQQMHAAGEPGKLKAGLLQQAYVQSRDNFDPEHGGFGGAPKFPTAHRLLFLLRYWHRSGDGNALYMVEATLDAMRRGGMFDQLGYGFHRYSTDAEWLLPHFEKMLYDQALLLMAYAEAYQATGKQRHAETARQIADYVLGEMQSPEGGFYSADDADSEGEEGRFYVWRMQELTDVLGKEDASFAARIFGVLPEGNVRDESTGQKTGANVLHLAELPADQTEALRLEGIRKRLLAARSRRVHPLRDDKVLTDWNGLMIAALAIAGRALDEPAFTVAASSAADFLLSTMRDEDGRLLHRWRKGRAGLDANLDDYAFLIWGLIELYQATLDPRRLQSAVALNATMLRDFDAPGGGLYFTAGHAETLLVRPLDGFDDAIPSGNAVGMMNLIRLSGMTGDAALAERAARIPPAFADMLNRAPAGFIWLLAGMQLGEADRIEVVLSGGREAPGMDVMLDALSHTYHPGITTLLADPELAAIAPFIAGYDAQDPRATAYVCRGGQCHAPTSDVDDMQRMIEQKGGSPSL